MKWICMPLVTLLAVTVFLAACGPKPNPDLQIRQAIAQTMAAVPDSTRAPIPTSFSSPTPLNLAGLFCEYQFCIGHPPDMAFFDVSAQQNPGAPSTYTQGILAAYSATLFIQVMWQIAPGTTDPTFLLDLILDENFDTPSGSPATRQVGSLSAVFTSISTSASPDLPFGAAAAWACRDRVFAWKVFTPDTSSPEGIFNDAAARFICQ
jgi:hypothetical protein